MALATPIARRDGPQKVTGAVKYAGDITFPGMLVARLVTSPHAAAKIVNIDTSAAKAIPGVVAVYTAADLNLKGMESGARRLNFLAVDLLFVLLRCAGCPPARGGRSI